MLFATSSFAQSGENQQIVFDGSLTDNSGNVIDLSGASLVFYVSANGCYLYGETTSAAGDSSGNILHRIGSGVIMPGSPNSFAQNLFFGNVNGTTTFAGNNCSVTASDTRLAQVYYAAQGITATIKLGTVPYAHNATMFNGKSSADFLQVTTDSNTLFYSGSAGQILTKSASGLTWTNSSLTASQITAALGYTPLNGSINSATVISALGYTPASASSISALAVRANNLSDLTSATLARTNLGLGILATKSSVNLETESTGTLPEARLQSFANITSGSQYTKVTVDGKGRVTSGAQLTSGDISTALGYMPAASVSDSVTTITTGTGSLQAKIVKPDGNPLEAPSVNFQFTILDPSESCILYSETYSAINMVSTHGLISFRLGTGVKTYPVSATTYEQVFSNTTASLSCNGGGVYSPSSNDVRKIIMQYNDGAGWETHPAVTINAVPYAMFARDSQKLNGKDFTEFVQVASLTTCTASQSLSFNGASFSCVNTASVSAGDVVSALGYSPLSATASAVTTVLGYTPADSSTVSTMAAAVTTLTNATAASFSAITSSQWGSSGPSLFYNIGNVGLGTTSPMYKLSLSGTGSTADRKIGINDVQTVYLPDQTAFQGSIFIGTGGNNLSHITSQDGFYNTATGINALDGVTTGSSNVANGNKALQSTTTGFQNVAVGFYSLNSNVEGNANVATGAHTLSANTNGEGNVATGNAAANRNTTGNYNVALGASAFYNNINGSYNTAIGYQALYDSTGSFNIGIGYNAGSAITNGSYNVVIGSNTGSSITGSSNNILISDGQGIERIRVTGSGKVGIGTASPQAILHLAQGSSTVAPLKFTSGTLLAAPINGAVEYDGSRMYLTNEVGSRKTLAMGATSNSIDNISTINSTNDITLNTSAGSGNGLVRLNGYLQVNIPANGAAAQFDTPTSQFLEFKKAGTAVGIIGHGYASYTFNNSIADAIGIRGQYGVQIGSGNDAHITVATNNNVGVGTTTPAYKLDVSGTLRVSGQAFTNSGNGNFSILSDIRYKDVTRKFERGISDILKIDTIKFNYKKNNPLGSDSEKEYVGVSAQNLQQTIPEAVEPRLEKGQEYLTINTSPVLWAMLNAVKELYYEHLGVKSDLAVKDLKIEKLEAENASQAKELQDLKSRLERIERSISSEK